MKKYIALIVFTVIVLLITAIAPGIIISKRPNIKVIDTVVSDIQTKVVTAGKIEEISKDTVKSDIPLYIDEIEVNSGDAVKKGDLLFTVDKDKTISSLSSMATGAGSGVYAGVSDEMIQKYSNTDNIKQAYYAENDGIISTINVQNGNLTNPSLPIMTIANTSALQARVSISEDIVGSVAVGQKAIITGSGFKDREYCGTVTKIFPSATEVIGATSSQTVVVAIIKIDKPDKYLKPGFTAKVKIIVNEGKNVLMVPYSAVAQDDDQKEYVYKITNSGAKRQYIKTGREVETGIEVISGLSRGDRIAENPENLKGNYLLVNTVKAGDK